MRFRAVFVNLGLSIRLGQSLCECPGLFLLLRISSNSAAAKVNLLVVIYLNETTAILVSRALILSLAKVKKMCLAW